MSSSSSGYESALHPCLFQCLMIYGTDCKVPRGRPCRENEYGGHHLKSRDGVEMLGGLSSLIFGLGSDQLAFRRVGGIVNDCYRVIIHFEKSGRAIVIDHCRNQARLIQMLSQFSLKFLCPAARTQQRNQMSSRRRAPNRDSLRIDSIFLGISPKPTDGCFAVMDLGRPLGFPAQAVCDRSSDKLPV